MIDAVNTLTVQGATARSVPQASASAVAAASATTSVMAEQRYAASRIRVDNYLDMAIIEIRATDTGDVVRQYPSEYQIRAFQRAAEIDARVQQAAEREARADSAAPVQVNADVEAAPAPEPVSQAEATPVTYSAPVATGGSFSGASQADAASSQSVTV